MTGLDWGFLNGDVPMVRRSSWMLALSSLAFVGLSGCAVLTRTPQALVPLIYPHATEATLTESSRDHYQRVSSIARQDARALGNDLDLLFQTDRPSRLTSWHTR